MVGWSRFSPEKLEKYERRLRELSGVKLTPEVVQLSDSLYLHCHATNEPHKPLVILLHGYGGSGICYFTIVKELAEKYDLMLVDLLGMGRSCRPTFEPKGVEACEDFFVESLEQLRQVKGYTSFVLVGHSFGGYLSGCYYMKYPQYVRSIIFISPGGFNNVTQEQLAGLINKGNWMHRFMGKLSIFLWNQHFSSINIVRALGPFSKMIIKFILKRRLSNLSSDVLKALQDYFSQVTLLRGSGEYAITHILLPGAWARRPLLNRLTVGVPMAFLYGESDWMTPEAAHQLKTQSEQRVEVTIVPKAGHQVFWDNPPEAAAAILNFLESLE